MSQTTHFVVLQFLKQNKKGIKAIFIFSLLGNIFLLAIPFIIQQLVEQYAILVFQQATFFLIVLAVIFLSGIAIMRVLQMHLSERLQRRIFLDGIRRLKNNIFSANKLDKKLDFKSTNYIFETVNLQKSLVPLIVDGSTLAVQTILVSLVISFYHPLFFLYSTLIFIGLYYVLIVLGKKTEMYALEESRRKYDIVDSLQKASNQTNLDTTAVSNEVEEKSYEYFVARELRYKYYFKQALYILVIKIVASVLLLSLGGLLVVKNRMTIGQFVATELIVTNLLISLFKVTYLIDYWFDTVVGIFKLEKFLPDGDFES
jgi:putative ABC transport system ATP-binding protein